MLLHYVSASLLILPFVLCGYPVITPTKGELWPMPQNLVTHPGYLTISKSNFTFISTGNDCRLLHDAFIRYYLILFASHYSTQSNREFPLTNEIFDEFQKDSGTVTNLQVYVQQKCEDYPHQYMDEQYELKICSPNNVNPSMILISRSVWGALRGLETFAQLVLPTMDSNIFKLNCVQILDYPRFPYRGVMLDTSRHFLPVSKILENLDLMAMNKFNTFHWHIVDSPSFPFQSLSYPDLSEKGAYSKIHVYSEADVSNIIEYGRQRGIRVIPEFDTPGHMHSWGQGNPGLLTTCYGKDNLPDGNFGPIDPSKEDNYDFLQIFFQEVSSRFQDHYLHLGGDEVSFECWKSNPNISIFMEQKNISSYKDLESYYVSRLLSIISNLPKKNGYMVWQEVFDNDVAITLDTVVHVWKFAGIPTLYQKEMAEVTAAGYQVLLSSCWYLNFIHYGNDWDKYYNCDPQDFNGTTTQKGLVMGGEACMWGEYVDRTNLTPRLWPRASAVAEKLWSSKRTTNNANAAAPRLEEHRCRLLKRGFQVQPANGPSFC